MKFRKKPVEIEAFRLGFDHIPDWFMDCVTKNSIILRGDYKGETSADIETLEGVIHAKYGDFIIKGVNGEIYPCKPDIFDKTYEVSTNRQFDRIKAMSVEEMAQFIRRLIQAHLNKFCNEMELGGYILTAEENKEVEIEWKKWLESEEQGE